MSTLSSSPIPPANNEAKYTAFEKKLCHLINCESMENGSNTPDYMLANYLVWCLRNYERTVNAAKAWHSSDWK